ncbi:exonuclease domain-containing protein [Butyrivibrio hungatei]|uniref:Exonuclease n=1 Tax=Butyrivibrio hungatei TaxID=185008 RepID=A0A1D9P303_9FIRM|nr:exonuclease domain-containing protein [Butyrivibrio hungatei]AOZ96997.1 exonuclease [Butyrivibrio hungatei]
MIGLIIACLLGWAGGYRFYKKQYGLGVLYLLTFGLLGIGWIVDIITAAKTFMKNENLNKTLCEKQVRGSSDTSAFTISPEAGQTNTSPQATFYIHSSKDTEKNMSQLKERFIVIDTETTGLDSENDRIISISAMIYENMQPVHNFYTLVNPQRPIPSDASEINEITDSMVINAPSEHDMCKDLLAFCGDAVFGKTLFVAYNSTFDAKFIKSAMERSGFPGNIRHFDVMSFAKKRLPELKNYKQVTVAKHLGISAENAHNAVADCKMCAEILIKLIKRQDKETT